ncbi:MAG: uroporphyrinogen decarboxylase [Candidatus Dormibacteria bacterium]
MIPADSRLLRALRQEPVDATPVWFMRQAGRSLARYRELRDRFSFMELATNADLAAEITCLPVRSLGVDAAVIFADIMLPLLGMGVEFNLRDSVGPVVATPIRTKDQVRALRVVEAEEATPHLFESIRQVRRELSPEKAVIGFGAAPFTLACYLVDGQGSRDFPQTRALMRSDPSLWHTLMSTLTEVLGRYLRAQVEGGADAIHLFDSWAGVVDRASFEAPVGPHLRRLTGGLRPLAPVIYFSTASFHLLEAMADCGVDALSVDWRVAIGEVWRQFGADHSIQGNLDPATVLAPWPVLEREAMAVLAQVGGRSGHVFNLGHGVLPQSDPDQLRRLVDLVHGWSPQRGGVPFPIS